MNASEAAAWLAEHGGPSRSARWVREHVPARSAGNRRYWWTTDDLAEFVEGTRPAPAKAEPKPKRARCEPRVSVPVRTSGRDAFEAEMSS